MRFNLRDWLLLGLASALASMAMVVLGWRTLDALAGAIGFTTLDRVQMPVTLTLGGISVLVTALAEWLVLRRCVRGLRLDHWLMAAAAGLALGAVVGLPSFMLRMFRGADAAPRGDLVHLLAHGLSVIAVGAALLLPLGLLLRRLTGASAWPLVAAGAVASIVSWLVVPVVGPWVLRFAISQDLLKPFWLWAALMVELPRGMLYGLTIGAGLFLMARLRLRPATAA